MSEQEALEKQIALTFHKPEFCPYCPKCEAERKLVELLRQK